MQSAQKIHLYGVPEHKDRITRWNAEGRSGLYAGARHYLRLLRSLVKNQVPYLAPAGRTRLVKPEPGVGFWETRRPTPNPVGMTC